MEILIPKDLIDSNIIHDEFVTVSSKMKEEVKNPKKAV